MPPFATHANDGAAIAAQTSTGALYTTLANTGGATPLGAELGGVIADARRLFVLEHRQHRRRNDPDAQRRRHVHLQGRERHHRQRAARASCSQNGATACNIFWQVTSAATLNGVTFSGNVVAQAGVTLGVGASLNGRALTTAAGAVTMSGGNTVGGCSAAAPRCVR